eukprot:Skav213343  [mRNA]  locus=scaffold3340:500481:502412:+ [translate_table: standard]
MPNYPGNHSHSKLWSNGSGVFIFLHGFGDSARGFVSQLPKLLQLPSVRYVLPTAPSLGGMRSWFTQAAMMDASPGSAAVTDSVNYVHHLIRQQIARGVPAKKIFVGGFSQGTENSARASRRISSCVFDVLLSPDG